MAIFYNEQALSKSANTKKGLASKRMEADALEKEFEDIPKL